MTTTTAAPTERYSTVPLRSSKVAVVDNQSRTNVVAFIGTPTEVEEFLADYYQAINTCECELDWNCPMHADRMYTAIERINDAWAQAQDGGRF